MTEPPQNCGSRSKWHKNDQLTIFAKVQSKDQWYIMFISLFLFFSSTSNLPKIMHRDRFCFDGIEIEALKQVEDNVVLLWSKWAVLNSTTSL